MQRRFISSVVWSVALLLAQILPALAQEYPTRPIRVVVPLSPIAEPAAFGSLVQPATLASSPPQIQLPSRPIDAYLEAHQEFSPSRTIQGLVPYARTVSATGSPQSGR